MQSTGCEQFISGMVKVFMNLEFGATKSVTPHIPILLAVCESSMAGSKYISKPTLFTIDITSIKEVGVTSRGVAKERLSNVSRLILNQQSRISSSASLSTQWHSLPALSCGTAERT
ncbi:hypothetical protein LINPERHAP2_LOCUS21308 [Linum perenne]